MMIKAFMMITDGVNADGCDDGENDDVIGNVTGYGNGDDDVDGAGDDDVQRSIKGEISREPS